MKWSLPRCGLLGVAVAICVFSSGCNRSASQQRDRLAEGRQYLLSEEPAGSQLQHVLELREALENGKREDEIVLVGRVDGLSLPTWDPDRAAFMVADLSLGHQASEHADAPKHDKDNCPFCKAKTKKELAGLALVEIVDSGGNVPPIDARELLGLSDHRVVVIRGTAALDQLGTLVVRATGLFVRPESVAPDHQAEAANSQPPSSPVDVTSDQ